MKGVIEVGGKEYPVDVLWSAGSSIGTEDDVRVWLYCCSDGGLMWTVEFDRPEDRTRTYVGKAATFDQVWNRLYAEGFGVIVDYVKEQMLSPTGIRTRLPKDKLYLVDDWEGKRG